MNAQEALNISLAAMNEQEESEKLEPIDKALEQIKTAASHGHVSTNFRREQLNYYQREKLKNLGYTIIDNCSTNQFSGAYLPSQDPAVIMGWKVKWFIEGDK
jgi:hypothetical protein